MNGSSIENIDKMKIPMKTSVAAVVLLAGTALGGAAHAACSPDYEGVTLTAVSQTGPFIASALRMAGDTWEEKTCGELNIVEIPFGELYPKYITGLTTGSVDFDIMTYAPAWLGDFAAYLSEMPESYRTSKGWLDIAPVYRDRLMVWNDKVISQSMDGDVHTLQYRLDLFNDSTEQAAFKEKYGYELAPPATWDQYYDIAEFFTRPDDNLWGTAEAMVRGGQQFWFFFSHAASYTNDPDEQGGMFFDPKTMDARINNPGWVKALEDYIKTVAVSPPGATGFSSGDIRTAFSGGKVAMNFDWGDTGTVATDPDQSSVAGNVGSALLPGSTEIWSASEHKWKSYETPVQSPFMAFGGWQAGVPESSNQKEAAWNFVAHLTNAENSIKQAVTGGTGVNPYRTSHFDVSKWTDLMTDVEAESYLAAQQGSIEAENVALDMRLPGYFSYTEILEIELSKALAGQVSPQEALDQIAEEWDRLTDDFGRESQLAAYRASMGIE
ncbi:MAG: extracellular solute-binding protein [Granulosicoccus sp.]